MSTKKLPPIDEALGTQPFRTPTPERFKLCAKCGQSYDTQHMGEVFHHTGSEEAHAPLLAATE